MSFTALPDAPRFELPDRGVLGDLARGVALPFRALRLIARTPKLRGLAALSALVTAVTLAGAAVGAWPLAHHLAVRLIGDGSLLTQVLATSLSLLLWVVLFTTSALTLPNLLLAPLQDPLSEATEEVCGGYEATAFSVGALARGTITSLRHTLGRLSLMILGFVVLWPLNLVPGAGSVLWLASTTLWSSFWLSAEQLSTPMARRLRPFGEVVRTLRRRPGLAFGLGGCLWVVLWVPVLNFFLMPIAVVAGTLLFQGLLAPGGNVKRTEGVGVP